MYIGINGWTIKLGVILFVILIIGLVSLVIKRYIIKLLASLKNKFNIKLINKITIKHAKK